MLADDIAGVETQKALNILPHTTHPPDAGSLPEQRYLSLFHPILSECCKCMKGSAGPSC